MIHINEVIVVEGKYDREQLKKITDAPIICTYGFQLYRSPKIINSLRTLSKKRGIIVLTDSDRAGFRIRNYIKQCLGESANIKQAYIPAVKGKEKRKERAGADGLLGVEGIDEKTLEEILKKSAAATEIPLLSPVTKAEFYADGFTGRENSAELRRLLCREFSLPPRISANALLDMINKVFGAEEYRAAAAKIQAQIK